MSVLSPARGYALWAPSYAETAVSALESAAVDFSRTFVFNSVATASLALVRLLSWQRNREPAFTPAK